MKPIEELNWLWMKRNLHEQGFEKLVEKINELVIKVNEIEVQLSTSKLKKAKDASD